MSQSVTQVQSALSRLRQFILDMEIRPGERITERHIEDVLGISRTSVRTALFYLENEGLVLRKGRGWFVSPINIEEISHLCDYRIILEVASVTSATYESIKQNIDTLDNLVNMITQHKSYEEFYRAGSDFHICLAGLSGNIFIIQGVENATLRLRRARWLAGEHNYGGAEGQKEITALLKENKTHEAALFLKAHLDRKKETLLEALRKKAALLRQQGSLLSIS